jgi:kynureninase
MTTGVLIGDEAKARAMDAADPLREHRALFNIPPASAARDPRAALTAHPGEPRAVYLTGNSLGCQPKAARDAVESELHDWAALGVEGHTHGRNPWLPYHELFRHTGARLVGARPGEVVMMNTLTVNLHLLMVSLYRPTASRFKIIIEDSAFPSDSYAVWTHAHARGVDPARAVVRLKPRREGDWTLTTDEILAAIEEHGPSTALLMLGGVNYLTGQWFDMPRITAAAKRAGCVVGWDLAHAAGNVPMDLHDWDVDFAAWCSYKYLNSGPGAVAGAYVHERHGHDATLPRFAGWWGNDPGSRFTMRPEFVPRPGADGWQCSNPPILSLAPLKASLEIFDRVGMKALREKSLRLTAYLESLIDEINRDFAGGGPEPIQIITPRDPARRGCQLSLLYRRGSRDLLDRLKTAGVICDFREPSIIRAAPVPLYTTFHDVWAFAKVLRDAVGADMTGNRP